MVDRVWVLLEDEYPATVPRSGQSVTFSCRWNAGFSPVPREFWKDGRSLLTEPVPGGQRVYSASSAFEAAMDQWTAAEAGPLDGIAEVDRYLWIDVDYCPSFQGTVLQRRNVCTSLRAFETGELGHYKVIPASDQLPDGYYIYHRLAEVEIR